MDYSLSFYGIAALSVLLTGISKSGFGGGLGLRLHRYVDQRIFVTAVYVFLALAAAKLLYDGGSALLS